MTPILYSYTITPIFFFNRNENVKKYKYYNKNVIKNHVHKHKR